MIKEKKTYFIYLAILFLIAVIYPRLINPDLGFGNQYSCDTWHYVHYALDYKNYGGWPDYMFSRLPAILPAWIVYKIFNFDTSHLVLYYLKVAICFMAIFFAFKQIFNLKTTSLILSLWVLSPLYTASASSSYPADIVDIFIFISLGYSFRSLKSERKKWDSFFAGFFYLLALHSNLKISIYTAFIPLMPFLQFSTYELRLKLKYLISFIVGGLASTLLGCLISYFILGNDFLFFIWQLKAIARDIAVDYERDIFRIFRLSNLIVVLFISIGMVIISYVSRKEINYKAIWISVILTVGTYGVIGGNLFISTSLTWGFPVFFILVGGIFEKYFTKEKYSFLFPLIFMFVLVFVTYRTDFYFQEMLFNLYGVKIGWIYLGLGILIGIFVIQKKFLLVQYLGVIILASCLGTLRPELSRGLAAEYRDYIWKKDFYQSL